MTPSSGISAGLPFRFRPRREKVDWRRIHAVDIDHVVSQLDVDVLQEHINTVTFCSLDAEQCQRCQSPMDLTLMKLFRLAQLSVEWLLHCQDFLTLNLRTAEERLTAADVEREKLLAEQLKQKEKMKAMTTELKQRRKIIKTQQSLFSPHITSSQKVGLCSIPPLVACRLHLHVVCIKQTASSITLPPFAPTREAPALLLFPKSIHNHRLHAFHIKRGLGWECLKQSSEC